MIMVVACCLALSFSGFRKKPMDPPPEKTPAAPAGTPAFPIRHRTIQKLYLQVLSLPRLPGSRTMQGDILTLVSGCAAVVTGVVALFVDLPLIILVILSVVSLCLLYLTIAALRYRFRPVQPGSRESAVSAKVFPPAVSTSQHTAILRDTGADISLPEESDPDILDQYWVLPPYVYIKIVRNGKSGFTYTVMEPPITQKEHIVLQETFHRLRKVIIYDDPDHPLTDQIKPEPVVRIIRDFFPDIAKDRLSVLTYYVHRDLSGLGPLEALMQDPALEDISCNGEKLPVFVFHRNFGSIPTSILFQEGELNLFVLKLAQKANKQISLTNPMLDATLPGGSRVQITYSNVISLRGSSFTIRKFRAEPMTPLDLLRSGTFSAGILAFLWLVIEHRRSLIIAGGTASGKTTTMNAISLFIPLNAKIVSLEDTHEIQLPHKNWLANLTRELNTPGIQGNIDLFSLLKSSMRQRPEYIIVGEVRGKEAQTLFQAMNTGHATLSTIHAGSVREAINRLTHEPINVPRMMFSALDLVITQSINTHDNNRIRRCLAIHEITVDDNGTIIPIKLYEWDIRTDTFRKVSSRAGVLDEIAAMRGWSPEQVLEELKKREEFLTVARDASPPDILDLAHAIHNIG